jgi:pyrimidine operon attenuation protein/uracil phosphoribosyltransferase
VHPQVKPSKLPFKVDNQHVILVDDVLYTGRTVRAAMNEIFDFGRPASITLVALVDRSGRELPIEAQVVGEHLSIGPNEQIKLSGPEPMELRIVDTSRTT